MKIDARSGKLSKKFTPSSAELECVQVFLRSGRAFSVLLVTTDQSCTELRGKQMFDWLNEWSQRWQRPTTKSESSSSQTSLAFGRKANASTLAQTLRQARR